MPRRRFSLSHALTCICVFSASLIVQVSASSALAASHHVGFAVKHALNSRAANVHVSYKRDARAQFPLIVTYGSCDGETRADAHHTVSTLHDDKADRLVWVLPEDVESNGCLSAWATAPDGVKYESLVGRSEKLAIQTNSKRWMRKRQTSSSQATPSVSIAMNNASGIDAEGPWFDGVAALQSGGVGTVNTTEAKAKKIALVGAGMANLMTWLALNMSGFHNIEILEAGQRLGGRVHTEYLEGSAANYSSYQYQEMGPMRFPETVKYGDTNETLTIQDHKPVFQLADIMNRLNGNNSNFTVNFIPWIQKNANGLYYFNGIKKPNGMAPTVTEIDENKNLTLQIPKDPMVEQADAILTNLTCDPDFMRAAAANVYKAHKSWIDNGLSGLGGEDWSEFAYLHNILTYDLNVTDQVGASLTSAWYAMYDCEYFSATQWRTIDGGLSRLPFSFYPHVGNITRMNTVVERAEYLPESNQVSLSWKNNFTDLDFQNATYDYAIVGAPFSKVRSWRFPNTLFDPTLGSAIKNMPYTAVCKVALQFQTRFWEHFDQPIVGGCSTTSDIPGIGSICYPSYNLNASGPGVMLASYSDGEFGLRFASMSEAEHVQYVLNAMTDIHGEVAREQYTGKHARRCWVLDPYETASWASPSIGMHKLYIPAYFKTQNNMIFVGEHTSYTHAWIASALESGVRGAVQLLLHLGLVDEAKNVTQTFMGRWIDI